MNLHPIFVHFPVALLSVYALMELVRFKKVIDQSYWFYVKGLFLMIGGLGALAAYFTGNMAKQVLLTEHLPTTIFNFSQVIRLHEDFAKLSVAIFGLLAAGYLFLWMEKENFSAFAKKMKLDGLWKFLLVYAKLIVETRLVIFLSLIGLICITITGGLGGVMVYGPNADPFFGAIYRMMFLGY